MEVGDLLELRRDYLGRAEFLLVYVREAHAEDEWSMETNRQDGVVLFQPRTADQRTDAACTLVDRLDIDMTTVVDDMDDTVGRAYGAWPERLYVIDADGRIGYQGGFGPFDFHPHEVAAYLARTVGPRDAGNGEDADENGADAAPDGPAEDGDAHRASP